MDISMKYKVPYRHRFYETTFHCPCHNCRTREVSERVSMARTAASHVFGLTYQCLGGCHQLLQVITALKLVHHVCQQWTILLSEWGKFKSSIKQTVGGSVARAVLWHPAHRIALSDWWITETWCESHHFAQVHPPPQKVCRGWERAACGRHGLPSDCASGRKLVGQVWCALRPVKAKQAKF